MMSNNPTLLESLTVHWHHAKTLRKLRIYFDPEKCRGIWQCYQVCPIGCWLPDRENRVVQHIDTEKCIACGACVLQCPEGAIELK